MCFEARSHTVALASLGLKQGNPSTSAFRVLELQAGASRPDFSSSVLIFLFMYMCVWGNVCHLCAGAYKGPKRVSDPLAVDLRAAVSSLMHVLGLKLQSSERAKMVLTIVSSLQPHSSNF